MNEVHGAKDTVIDEVKEIKNSIANEGMKTRKEVQDNKTALIDETKLVTNTVIEQSSDVKKAVVNAKEEIIKVLNNTVEDSSLPSEGKSIDVQFLIVEAIEYPHN